MVTTGTLPVVVIGDVVPAPGAVVPDIALPFKVVSPADITVASPAPTTIGVTPELTDDVNDVRDTPVTSGEHSRSLEGAANLLSYRGTGEVATTVVAPVRRPIETLVLKVETPVVTGAPERETKVGVHVPVH